jgi:hypothetical protein
MNNFSRELKDVLGLVRGTAILTIKSLPRLFLSPYVGAVRGISEEIKRSDAEYAAFRDSYIQKLDIR